MTFAAEPRLTAPEWAAIMRDPLRDQGYTLTKLGPAITDFLAWLELARRAPRTIDQYERDLAAGAVLYPDHALADWTSETIMHVLLTFPPRSRKRARAAWNGLFRWAYLWDRVDRNPMEKIPPIAAEPQRYIETFRDAEVEALLGLPLVDGALMAVLFDAGLRKAEACALRVERVDLEGGQLVILHGKGSKDRVVPMAPRLSARLAELATLEGLSSRDHLWYTTKANAFSRTIRRATPIGEASFHRWWERCTAAAGVEYRPRSKTDDGRGNPHAARHTFALRWLRGTVGRSASEAPGRPGRVETLQKVMGHASIQTTIDLYGHLDVSDVAADLHAMTSGGVPA